jgi:hypothetical protein
MANDISISVFLIPSADPPVSVSVHDQDVVRGTTCTIYWNPGTDGKTFKFVNLTAVPETTELPNPPFSNKKVTDKQISITDLNNSAKEYAYVITVEANGTQYKTRVKGARPYATSGSDPTIRND